MFTFAHLLTLVEVLLLIGMSAIGSGLNLSLMSLDVSDLERRARYGNKLAKKVLPLRRNSHLSLASILLTNVAAISATSLVLEHHLNGLVAGLVSTLLIVIFGEILPQALFLKNALKYTAFFSPLLKWMNIVSYPVSKPLQLLLDKLFGPEAAHLHTRRELGMIIADHLENAKSELDDDEAEIMRGALSLSDKRVRDITTDIKDVYWVTPDTIVDAAKIDEIKEENWSRIPVFNKALTEVYGVMLMKDLVDIDFDERSYKVSELPLKNTVFIGSMTALDTMFRKFIAARTHLMPVERNDEIIGIVTIEDLIEEIIGHEIEDESDQARDD
jgi:metal transporter CNNM